MEEAVQTSYRKGGERVCISDDAVSKETVMNKIHVLQFPKVQPLSEKKALKYLYIDADEDHVSLQHPDKKGDIRKKNTNTAMPKMIYVYEGVSFQNGRNELINKKYFGGLCEGHKGIEALWKEVWEYIKKSYDTEELVKVYINGDGAGWIKSGTDYIEKSRFVLDRFHMHKYIIGATSHLLDSVEDARREIYSAIYSRKKRKAQAAFEKILAVTEGDSKRKTVEAAMTYIMGNWAGIMQWVKDKNKEVRCSAEGHISHVYASRMSSRPLGWSREGVDKMSRLRIYHANGGDMLELVRYQKKALPVAAGCEEVIYSCSTVIASERRNRNALGRFADLPSYSIPYTQVKKIAALKNHIWGL